MPTARSTCIFCLVDGIAVFRLPFVAISFNEHFIRRVFVPVASEKELKAALDDKANAVEETRYQLREATAKNEHQQLRIAELEKDVIKAQQALRERHRIERKLVQLLEAGAPPVRIHRSSSSSSSSSSFCSSCETM